MIITEKNDNKNNKKFKNLKIGDVFRYELSACTFMKVSAFMDEEDGEHGNTIALDDGSLCCFDSNDEVILLDNVELICYK